MNSFAIQKSEERAIFINQYAITGKIPAYIAEKDFWVCWLLGQIFAIPALGNDCVFKGGTSLSKVFNAIDRFSEDIDLSLNPVSLGWQEKDLDDAPSKSLRQKLMKQIEIKCAEAVQKRFLPKLESVVHSILGPCPTGKNWLAFQVDASTHSPVILFPYPQAVPSGNYIPPVVKIEFGSLTDQRPTGTHLIRPLIAKLAPDAFTDFRAEVVALEIERTFWEKATILHAEYHRPAEQSLRDRFSRHYSDFAALWKNAGGQAARSQLNLLERVRLHKSRFFASKWANYDTAKPGSFRLAPKESRLPELRRDYAAMEPMFLSPPPSFEQVLSVLREAEQNLNAT